MASIATVVPSLLGVGGGAGLLGLARKAASADAASKKSSFRLAYGHESILTRFGMPLYYCRWHPNKAKRGQVKHRKAGQWFKFPLLHKQPPTDMRPQKHECRPLKIVTRDCVAFLLTPVVHFQVEDVFKKQLGTVKWDDYLFEGIVQAVTSEGGKVGYRQLIRGDLDPLVLAKAQEIGKVCGIRVDDVGFKWKTPTAYGEVVVSREALADASALGLNSGLSLLRPEVLEAPAAIVASLLGPPVVTTSVGQGDTETATAAAETAAAAQADAAAARAEVVQLRTAQA